MQIIELAPELRQGRVIQLDKTARGVCVTEDEMKKNFKKSSIQLQYIELPPKLQLGQVMQLDKKCRGVCETDDEIYVTCHMEERIVRRKNDT